MLIDSCYLLKDSMSWWEGVDETRLLVAPEPSVTGKCGGQLLSLRHPKSGNVQQLGNSTCFLLINGGLQEIHWFKQSYGSWEVCMVHLFIVRCFRSIDGRLYTATPVDPVFILLPIFEEARMKKGDDPGKFRQLDEMIFVNGYPGYRYLLSIAETSMQVVCDVKVFVDIVLGKASVKPASSNVAINISGVDQLKRTLLTLDKNYAARDEKDTLTDAVSVLGEYLKEEPWLELLCSNLKLDLQAAKTADIEVLPIAMENGPASFEPVKEKNGSDKKTTRSARQTKKAKVETDSRNIRDMFTRASRRK
ncbi:hypothetical protein RHGRI_021138 [Rhododendron griersonianum]|uniref:Uncharacterized protein n=1 Tax=Rhododendron griersonianum TaxID=479676 RepID=A0AAV6JKG6_9ERIC|nr:hypothetical protein RHGRI_021138 [Rhododendron griersonianum]